MLYIRVNPLICTGLPNNVLLVMGYSKVELCITLSLDSALCLPKEDKLTSARDAQQTAKFTRHTQFTGVNL